MPIQQPTFQPNLNVTITASSNVKITNLAVATSNTEEAHLLVDGLKQVSVRCRDQADLKIAFNLGDSGTNYYSIFKGTCLDLTDIDFNSKTIYIQSNKAPVIIEIIELY